jgi:hypothetical protein
MDEAVDPTVTLEGKILDFAATLTEEECTVLHQVLHLAAQQNPDVEGFASNPGASADPCEGGEVTFPNTFNMLGNLHTSLHVRRPGTPKRFG